MTAPDFRMRVNPAQKDQFRCSAPTNEHDTRVVPHDLRHQPWYFAIRKSARAVGSERRERAVIVQQECACGSIAHTLHEHSTHIELFGDLHLRLLKTKPL